jgi:hypothetical protein
LVNNELRYDPFVNVKLRNISVQLEKNYMKNYITLIRF